MPKFQELWIENINGTLQVEISQKEWSTSRGGPLDIPCSGLNKLLEMRFKFPFNLIAWKSTRAF